MSGIKGVGGGRGYIGRLSTERSAAETKLKPRIENAGAGAAGMAPGRVADARGDAGRLASLGVPEKVAKEHGAALEKAIAEVSGIADFVGKLEPWRKKAIDRIVEQLYKNLGSALGQTAPETRGELATSTLGAIRGLMEKTGGGDQLASTTSAALGLFESGLRLAQQKRLTLTPEERLSAMSAAVRAVGTLKDELGARGGVSTALNVFPVLVEQLERSQPKLDAAGRSAVWSAVSKLLVETGPKTGITQDVAAELAKALGAALDAKPKDVGAAITDARARFLEAYAQPRREMEDGLGVPSRLPEGTVGRAGADALERALRATLAAHPATSSPLYPAMFTLKARVDELAVHDANQLHFVGSIAKLVEKLGPTEAAERAIAFLAQWTPSVPYQPLAVESLARAADAPTLGAVARGLAESALALGGHQAANVPGLDAELARLEALPGGTAVTVALALANVLAGGDGRLAGVVRHAIELAEKGGKNDLGGYLAEFATRDQLFAQTFGLYNLAGNDVAKQDALAAAVASISAGTDLGNGPNLVASAIRTLEMNLPAVRTKELVAPDAADRPGLWRLADPGVRYRNAPGPSFEQLVAAAARGGAGRQDGAVQTSVARAAIALSAAMANLDGNPEIPFHRVLADFEAAVASPEKLTFAKAEKGAVALRAQKNASVAAFLDAHPSLPPELALTAGLHLAQPEMAWLADRMEKTAGRDTRRALRDFVLGCVDAGRVDLVEALRTTQAPPRAVAKAIAFVAAQYRLGQVVTVPFDELVGGFKANQDAIGAIEKRKTDAALAAIGLGELLQGGGATEAGIAELVRCQEPIKYILEHLVDGYVAREDGDPVQCGPLRAPFAKALQAVADGTWPAVKYENEGGKRQMATLSPAQQAIWKQETVTAADVRVDPAEEARLTETMQLLRGVVKALERSAPKVEGLPALDWSKASLGTLERAYAEKVAALHEVPKGSADHKRLSGEIGPMRSALSLVRFAVGVTSARGDAKAALLDLKETLRDAVPALKAAKMGAAVEVVRDASYEAAAIKTSPKQGLHAFDTDEPEALLASSRGGCCDYTSYRRWVPTMMLVDANQKVIRVYDGDKWVFRTLFHFHEATIPGNPPYHGPVLFINAPVAAPGANYDQRYIDMVTKHALAKAVAMGVPVAGSVDFSNAARQMGLEQTNVQTEFEFTPGTTGLNFSNYVFNSPDTNVYMYDVNRLRGNNPKAKLSLAINLVMPPKG